ncbi:MAG: hypothetical protein ACPGVH_00660 [Chitinophagales bacterium]
MKRNTLGIILFILYFIQYFFELKLDFLEQLQLDQSYKRWSGLFLFSLILAQWFLSIKRLSKSQSSISIAFYIDIHKWIGIFLPLAFYIHSTEIGYAILLLLSIVFFINVAMAFINTKDWLEKYPQYFNVWLIFHIFLSVFVLFISIVHIWQVFFYS